VAERNTQFDLTGKTIMITGASSGIGQTCAMVLSGYGAKLILQGRDIVRLNETKAMCTDSEKHITVSLNFLKEKVEDAFFLDRILKEQAPISGLIYAAGVSPTLPFKTLKKQQIVEVFQLNLFYVIELIQKILKRGIRSENGMSIVLISSVLSETGEKGKSLYGMTKSSLVALVKSLALEYAGNQIRFNAISPGVVNSPLSNNSLYRQNEKSMKAVIEQHPLGLGETEDVANAALYLISDASKWVTGTNLIIDGGYLSR
jgi:NAD(P)-dependent dehydrogenase (short-subunit alcohol dehydrogenase family)